MYLAGEVIADLPEVDGRSSIVPAISTLAGSRGVICGLWTQRENWGRHVLLGFGFFLINLAPFIGFISVPTWDPRG